MRSIYVSLQGGLEDYTTTERGDVGSWIRRAALLGLRQIITLIKRHSTTVYLSNCLTSKMYHDTIGAILKQSVERLDNVRQCAGDSFLALLQESFHDGPEDHFWAIENGEWFKTIFTG